jgi:hypothetical protein
MPTSTRHMKPKLYLDVAKIRLILSRKNANVASIWHESSFEVPEGGSSINNQPVPTVGVPLVNIMAPVAVSPSGTINLIDVPNLCTTISWSTRETKISRWYFASLQRIQFQHNGYLDQLASTRCQTISLHDLLQPRPQTVCRSKWGSKIGCCLLSISRQRFCSSRARHGWRIRGQSGRLNP